MSYLIADISKHNGAVDMEKLAAKVKGVIIRAGYRTASSGSLSADPKFAANIKAAEAAELPVGVYWWTTALSESEGKAEAEYLLKLVDGHKLAFPVFLDLEYYNSKREGRADHLSKAKRTKYALAFLQAIEKAGYSAGVYCNKDFWGDALNNSQLQNYARWIARYGDECGVDCDLWQYTSSAKGSSYGAASEHIDLSKCYTDFIGGKCSKFAEVSDKTNTSSTAASTEKSCPTVRKGDTGSAVKVLQKLLGGLTVDGIFGSKTETAVKTFQKENGLDVDGVVGVKTWGKLV